MQKFEIGQTSQYKTTNTDRRVPPARNCELFCIENLIYLPPLGSYTNGNIRAILRRYHI